MAFSRITITFNDDFINADEVSFTDSAADNLFFSVWVTLRSATTEVTTATPTGTPGEATAINYLAAFIADWGAGSFTTTQVLNVVTITQKTELVNFAGWIVRVSSDASHVIDSVGSIPFVATDRINVRSPYFLHAPIYDGIGTIFPTSVVYNIYIYTGDVVADKPVTPTYVFTKVPRYLNDQNIYIDISEEVQDYIENTFDGTLTHQSVFVQSEITTTHSAGTILDNNYVVAYDGFNLHADNVNFNPTESLMISNRAISVNYNDDISLPFYLGGDAYTIEYRKGVTVQDTFTVVPITIVDTDTTVQNVDKVNVVDTDNIRVQNTTQTTEFTIDVDVVTECIYDPVKVTFVNRHGIKQHFWTYKVSKEQLKTKNESYKSNVLNETIVNNAAVLSYDTARHTNKVFNKQANKSITLNTGYIAEDNNVIIEEILESESIWITVNSVIIPVNLTTKTLPLLTKRNDQLIKYTLKFDYSYNEIQNIR